MQNESPRRLFVMGGGGFSMDRPGETATSALDTFFFSLARRSRPRVLFVPTASGDAEEYIARFYEGMRRHDVEADHLSLFRGPNTGLRERVLSSDVIYVGGGNTRNLLVLWREWELDRWLREAYESGVVLGGVSAGAIVWFDEAVTDSVAGELRRLSGLRWLRGSACPHFDGELLRRPTFLQFVADGMPAGLGLDDNAAALFEDERLVRCVSASADARVWRVTPGAGRENDEAHALAQAAEILALPDGLRAGSPETDGETVTR